MCNSTLQTKQGAGGSSSPQQYRFFDKEKINLTKKVKNTFFICDKYNLTDKKEYASAGDINIIDFRNSKERNNWISS